MIQRFVDGRSLNSIVELLSEPSAGFVFLAGETQHPGQHLVELMIVDQAVSPTTYVLSQVRVELYGWGGPGQPLCGGASRVIPLPDQTLTLSIGERIRIPFEV